MTSFESYFYKDTTYGLTHLPKNTHCIIDTTLYLFYVSTDSNLELWKYTKSTGSDAKVEDRTQKIQSLFYDITNGLIYGIDCDNDGVSTDADCWWLDISDDSTTEMGTVETGGVPAWLKAWDIYKWGTDFFVLITGNNGDTNLFTVKKWNDPNWDVGEGNTTAELDTIGGYFVEVDISGTAYLLIIQDRETVDDCYIMIYEDVGPSLTNVETIADQSLPSSRNLLGIAYDDADTIYFTLNDDGDSKNYLYQYVLSTDTITKLEEQDIALMLDRNTIGTADSPFEFEKGFSITGSIIYRIIGEDNLSKLYTLMKIWDLGLTGGATIKAITDKYLIDSAKNVYLYTESLSELAKAEATYKTHILPKGIFEHTEQLSTDQLIEIYENNEGDYVLAFRGKAGRPTYRVRKGKPFYRFKPKNMGADDLKKKVSYTATAAGIDEVVIAVTGVLTDPYVYCDATSVPNIAVNMTYTFDDEYYKDALYVCSILSNGYWWCDPNGYLHFSTWAAKLISEWYYGSPDNFNDEVVGTSGTDIAFVDSIAIHDATLDIYTEWQDHKNVLRWQDDPTGGEEPSFTHLISASTSGTIEFWVGSNDVSENFTLRWYDSSVPAYIIQIRLAGNDLDYQDSLDVWQEIQAIANDTWYHIKIVWRADNTFDVYVAGVLKVDDVACNNNMSSGIDQFVPKAYGDSEDYCYFDAWGNVADSHYVEGYNTGDALTQTSANIGPPKSVITQIQYNDFSNVRGGWDETTSAPFEPTAGTATIAEHVQQYGSLLWDGRKIFSGAITQAATDAIVAGLKAWQGMVSNPVDMEMNVLGQYYYPVGYYMNTQYSGRTEFATATDRILIKNVTDFKRPGKIKGTFSDNVVRKR